jgi:hypothetical protein
MLSIVLVIALLIAGIISIVPGMVHAQDQVVVPLVGEPGTHFSFHIAGFTGDEKVGYWFTDPYGQTRGDPEEYLVDAIEGSAEWTWAAPQDAAAGVWTITAKGLQSGVEHTSTFEIRPPTVPEQMQPRQHGGPSGNPTGGVTKNVAPPVGPPGTRFAFYALGFNYREKVGYWVNGPDGTVYANDFKFVVKSWENRADWEWKAPHDATPGLWSTVARGFESEKEVIIYFEIADPNAPPVPVNTPPSPQAPAPSSSNVVVEPQAGVPGTRFDFHASGFRPGERVRFWASDPLNRYYEMNHYRTDANEDGHAAWNWKSPDDAMAGVWIMVGRGEESHIEKVSYFAIADPNAPIQGSVVNPSDVAVDPISAVPATRHFFFAHGFNADETVYFWATDPAGKEYDRDERRVSSNEHGRADWYWMTPPDAPAGIWTMYAAGNTSGVQRTIYFEVLGSGPSANTPVIVPQAPPDITPTSEPFNPPSYMSTVAVDPPIGAPGSRFFFFATGFEPNEDVYFWAVSSDGTEYRKEKYHITANNNGRADWNWKTPADASQGTWQMYAQGENSLVRQVIPFDVR